MELGLHLRLQLASPIHGRARENYCSPVNCCSHSHFVTVVDKAFLRHQFLFCDTEFRRNAIAGSRTRPGSRRKSRKPVLDERRLLYNDHGGVERSAEEGSEDEDEEEEAFFNLAAARTKSSSSPFSSDADGEFDKDESSLSTFLSLSEKPDRNMTLLDDYEMEELDSVPDPNHRSGYVAVLGKPNVGKSTLSNQMIGQKLSIVTDKPQTTRHRILGICSGPEYQMILYDTPGVIEKKMHKLDSMMMKNVQSAAVNADCVVVVVDASKAPQKIDDILEEGVGNLKDKPPTLLVLNKKDMIKPGEIAKKLEVGTFNIYLFVASIGTIQWILGLTTTVGNALLILHEAATCCNALPKWYEKFTDVDEVIPVSAKYGHGVDDVRDWILSKLPVGPAYYPKDITSEHPERFFVAEIVREKIFMQYRNEVPYACQVNVITYKSRPTAKDFIQVEIIVEKNSQKIILIGKEGKALKLLATAARLDIEDFLQKKVFLEVEVKVKENWRQDEGLLKHYGYGGQIRAL